MATLTTTTDEVLGKEIDEIVIAIRDANSPSDRQELYKKYQEKAEIEKAMMRARGITI